MKLSRKSVVLLLVCAALVLSGAAGFAIWKNRQKREFEENLELAGIALEEGDLQEAKSRYDSAMKKSITDPRAYLGLYQVCIEQQNVDEAEQLITSARSNLSDKNFQDFLTQIRQAEIENPSLTCKIYSMLISDQISRTGIGSLTYSANQPFGIGLMECAFQDLDGDGLEELLMAYGEKGKYYLSIYTEDQAQSVLAGTIELTDKGFELRFDPKAGLVVAVLGDEVKSWKMDNQKLTEQENSASLTEGSKMTVSFENAEQIRNMMSKNDAFLTELEKQVINWTTDHAWFETAKANAALTIPEILAREEPDHLSWTKQNENHQAQVSFDDQNAQIVIEAFEDEQKLADRLKEQEIEDLQPGVILKRPSKDSQPEDSSQQNGLYVIRYGATLIELSTDEETAYEAFEALLKSWSWIS